MITRIIRHLFVASLIAAFVMTVSGMANAASTLTTLWSFRGSNATPPDGANFSGSAGFSLAGLIMDASGALYGTTIAGGSAMEGTVFKLTPPSSAGGPWTEAVLYSFCSQLNGVGGCIDGAIPLAGLASDNQGGLYGTTYYGVEGTVFKLTPPSTAGGPWAETVLYSFCKQLNCSDGSNPMAGLISDSNGALYGTTQGGGNPPNDCLFSSFVYCGTVFKLTPPSTAGGAWTETVLYPFCSQPNCSDGSTPAAGLIFDNNGALYGTTSDGGNQSNDCSPVAGSRCGTVFKLTPPSSAGGAWTETVLYRFCSQPNCSDGSIPYAGLIFDNTGTLYGTTLDGGSANSGTVFKLTPPSTAGGAWTETVLHSFCLKPNCSDGSATYAGLIFDNNGALYGTTPNGGNISGNINGCSDKFGCGTVFKLTPPSTAGGAWTETVLYSFCSQPNCSDGSFPYAGLIFDNNGALYGTTSEGGSANEGTVFKFQTFAGIPGQPNCQGQSVSALAQQYGSLPAAAAALGYSSVPDLQNAVGNYCGG